MCFSEQQQKQKRWIVWKEEFREGNLVPVPYNFRTRERSDLGDFSTWGWGTFDEAVQAWQDSEGRYDGVAYIYLEMNVIEVTKK